MAAVCVLAALLFPEKMEPAQIITASDLHYLSPRLNDGGEAFAQMMENSDGKMTPYCDEIVSAFADQVIQQKPDVLILSGDLTFNGERASHEDLAEKLEKIRGSGIPVLVIPGNHDLENENAFRYSGAEYEQVDSVSAEEFHELYGKFGYEQAESVEPWSSSYLYRVNDDLYILMLDTNSLGENFVPRMSYDWIEEQLKTVKENRARVITVSHQNLFRHNENNFFGYQLYNVEPLVELYRSYGVKCNLSGHIHMQHVRKESGITEVTTSSLLVSPIQYGTIRFDGSITYGTQQVDVSGWAEQNGVAGPEYADFSAFSHQFFKEYSTSRLQLEGDFSQEEKRQMIDTFGNLNAAYFSGSVFDSQTEQEGIALWKRYDGRWSAYIETMAEETQRDFQHVRIR